MTSAPGPTAPSGFSHLDKARSLEVETPEHVRLGFELAGVGSRAAAVILDLMVLGLGGLVAVFALLAGPSLTGSEWLSSIGGTAAILLLFALQWGYFFIGEGFFGGRTLGKKWIGLRVIGQSGVPITPQAAALRNLLRIVDFQPAFSSVVGLGLIVFHPRSQRLGDIVAGTVVVRDRGDDTIPEEAPADRLGERPYLDARRFQVLEGYVQRREGLPSKVRSRLAGRVGEAMGAVVAEHPARHTKTLDDILVELHEEERPRQALAHGTSVQAIHLVRSQRAAWERLGTLLDRTDRRGLSALDAEELDEFTRLYRQVVADLARAHTYGGSLRLCFHLERLASEAHDLFYRDSGQGPSVLEWLRGGFPTALQSRRRYVLVSAALLFLPAFITYAGVRLDPRVARDLVPVEMVTRAEEAGDRLARGEQYVDIPPVQMSMFSSAIMTNNLQVAFMAVAGGILAGIGTLAVLVFNGINLGAVFALYAMEGAERLLWIWVLPHGVVELTAIVVAGAAGLCLGSVILAPGRRTRARALQEEGRTVLSLVAGAGVLLVLAGLIEGFVSPAPIPEIFKILFSGSVAILLFLYLSASGVRAAASGIGPAASAIGSGAS